MKSRILFEQMLGRGTRKGEQFPDKSHFTVFDCFDGTLLEYFRNATGITAEPPEKPTRDDQRDHRGHLAEPRPRLQRPLPGQAPPADRQGDVRRGPRAVRRASSPTATLAAFADELPGTLRERLHRHDEAPARPGLPGPARRTTRGRSGRFVVAYEHEDTVTSEWLIRDADGQGVQARGLPGAFADFVRENPAQIEAIRILLDRPQDWSTEALDGAAAEAGRDAASASPMTTCRRPTRSATTRPSWTSSRWSSTPPTTTSRC